ncbi:MotA/TolQ/ExbB proton channel family protein [Vibrio viridaestus]|uniref:MotA/TolQ/ExbB proton channel family protein n=1 Tax=Vibrio viridaestus TaxID=2487322 RepID=A0A3N9U269_9VIBR|nr:MotA/TolQ/ExbB proton channel family protein [Vibrio viridaestus]RQW63602.1 MotA/TolQ/ExbB proton channel family protein [Vibrio viridaestus]
MLSLLSLDHLFVPLDDFMSQGGTILWWLAFIVLLSWFFVAERIMFLLFTFPKHSEEWIKHWHSRNDRSSWYALSIREGWLSEAHILLFKHLNFIKVLVQICPMLGLLGTVTGMISVFDVMATKGTADPKLMASGISLATLPTMAGMVAALAGLFIHARLQKKCQMMEMKLEKSLRSYS